MRMQHAMRRWLTLIVLLGMLLSTLPASAGMDGMRPGAAHQAAEDVLYVALIWHQHQPVYAQDAETGIYARPWVRAHAAKDYLDMATILENYPDVHVTFNFTPSLIRQLDDLAAGAKDQYWVLAEVPAEELTPDQKRFILERFFDTNSRVIARFPRYQELAEARSGMGIDAAVESWTAQDFRDLQVLFNLAWTDPDWLAQEPLASLVARGRDYTEEDKAPIFAEHLRIIREVLPYHAELQRQGQIEVTMTPFAHPILPLLVDSNLAGVAMPEAELPTRFVFGQDAVGQVEMGVQLYRDHFGVDPRGMWPAEGSVAQQIVQMVASAGIQWMATDEDVLARSLPDVEDFTRNSADTVQQADALYRPYTVTGGRGGQVAILFRDHLISDKLGFEYSGMSGEAAAADLMQRLNNIQTELAEEGASGPHLVTILLDGENAWENYANDGKDFLNAMYRMFSEADNIQTVTPSEYLALTGEPQPLDELWPGSWITPDYSTWIGEPEENQAWEYLLTTRNALQEALPRLSADRLAEATEAMYFAEGSDWFWYFGADQDSGQDFAFDEMFRSHLRHVYRAISVNPPGFLDVPVIPLAAQLPDRAFTEPPVVTVDGAAGEGEWDSAAYYDLSAAGSGLDGLYYGIDEQRLTLRLDAADGFADGLRLGFYFSASDPAAAMTGYPREGDQLLGFGARRLVEVTFDGGVPAATAYTTGAAADWVAYTGAAETVAAGEGVLELSITLDPLLGKLQGGNSFNMRLLTAQAETAALVPAGGPVLVTLPDTAVPNVVLDVADPEGDDHGPGGYLYPTDVVFRRGAFDATGFVVGSDEDAVIFRVTFRGPVENDWGAPNGMGIHTVDIYIDSDGPANGARLLLPGRNAALPPEYAWDVAVWAEGWTPGIYRPGADGPVQVDGILDILTNAGQRRITIRVPRSALPEGDPAGWAYAVVVGSQEGYPSSGVWRLRDVETGAQQWRIGGAPSGSINHTRIMDVVFPEEGVQEAMLSDFTPSLTPIDQLGPDDFGQVPVLAAP